jgi:hypothetical protein
MKLDGEGVLKRFKKARSARSNWEDMWQDIYDYVMPAREGFYQSVGGEERTDDIFDETALVSTNEFVSRLSQGLIPAFDKWWRFEPGPEITDRNERKQLQGALDEVTDFVWETLHNSNFYNEAQESLYDIAVGWSTMIVDDGDDGQLLKFKTLPQCQTFWDTGPFKQVDGVFRIRHGVRLIDIQTIWPKAKLSEELQGKLTSDKEAKTDLVEASYRDWSEKGTPTYCYQVVAAEDKSLVIDEQTKGLGGRPYITPRWQVAAGECYGRGPLICALPAIRTTNLVTEMILENAQMAISGIWQIDDDGTINADNVEIVPGAVYARPVDSRGLERTDISGAQFNVADIVLAQQQENIRKALYAENLGPLDQTPRSATEINARMQNLGEQVAGPSARLKTEWLDPLLQRCVWLLERRGVLEMPRVDGRSVKIVAKSPLARAQRFNDIERIRGFAGDIIGILGPQAAQLFINQPAITSHLQAKWEVPVDVLRSEAEVEAMMEQLGAAQEPQQGGLPAQAEIGQ